MKSIIAILGLLTLTACGGGGGGETSSPAPAEQKSLAATINMWAAITGSNDYVVIDPRTFRPTDDGYSLRVTGDMGSKVGYYVISASSCTAPTAKRIDVTYFAYEFSSRGYVRDGVYLIPSLSAWMCEAHRSGA